MQRDDNNEQLSKHQPSSLLLLSRSSLTALLPSESSSSSSSSSSSPEPCCPSSDKEEAESLTAPLAHRSGRTHHRIVCPEPPHFIFGFGSVINEESRRRTVDEPCGVIPARLDGYRRAWNVHCPTANITVLGLETWVGGTVNGVLVPVHDDASLAAFDEREHGYVRVRVRADRLHACGWQALPVHACHLWTYVAPAPARTRPTRDYPIVQSYVDVVLTGCLHRCYGRAFARELLDSTVGWSRYWLNDRQTPRRPWLHCAEYREVDELLAERRLKGSGNDDVLHHYFRHRKLPVRYAGYFQRHGGREEEQKKQRTKDAV